MTATPSPSASPGANIDGAGVAKPLDWRKPTKRDRDEGGRDSALWIAPGFGGEYAIQADLKNFILWRVDDPYAFDTFPTVEAAKAHAEADWQKTIGRKLALQPSSAADAKPVAWRYELASAICADGTYTNWQEPVVRLTEPHVPPGSIRNLTPLYAQPHPSQQAGAEGDEAAFKSIDTLAHAIIEEWENGAYVRRLAREIRAILAALKTGEAG